MVSFAGSPGRNGHSGASSNGGTALSVPDPFITAKFWVEIDGVARAFFDECSGLQVETEVLTYAEGGLNSYTHKLPGRTSIGNLTLKRGVVQDDALWDWYNAVVNGQLTRRTVTILVYDNKVEAQSTPSIAWVLKDALPVKWIGPAFKANENAVAVNQLEFICGSRDGSGAFTRQTG